MATIEQIVTDQGNGGAYCSDCTFVVEFDEINLKWPVICPKCEEEFVAISWPWISPGGSDF